MNKRTVINTITACIIGLGVAGTASAQGPAVSSYQVRGEGGYATMYTEDECTWAVFDLSANTEVAHSRGGAPVSEPGGWAGYWSFNWCTGEEVWGDGYMGDIGYQATMNSATAHASFVAHVWAWRQTSDGYWDYVYVGTRDMEATVNWTAVGEAYRGMESWTARWGHTFSRSRWMGTSRDAEVSGTVTMDGKALTFGYAYGSFGSYHGGSTDIYRY